MKFTKALSLSFLALALCSFTSADAEPEPRAKAPLPPGDALPIALDAMLYGNAQTCRDDTQCPGAVCYYGACIGTLVVDQRWMQEAINARIVAAVGEDEELRRRVNLHLERVLSRSDTDLAFRARSLLVLEALGARAPLRRALEDPNEALQAAAALGLARLGFEEGLPLTSALTEHEQLGVASEALRALGTSQLPEALAPLLRTLNSDLDATLLRAALAGIAAHGDRRAIGPLRAWLDRAPEYLHHEILATMRDVTGTSIGKDLAAWDGWIAENPPPEPPAYTLRTFLADEDLGLPTP